LLDDLRAYLVSGQTEKPHFRNGYNLVGDPCKKYTTALVKLFDQAENSTSNYELKRRRPLRKGRRRIFNW
jgi:hypothetical protein